MTRRPVPQSLLGLAIIVIGVVALLNQLGVIELTLGGLFSVWWPSIIILVGLVALTTVPRAWFGPLVIIAVGVFFQLSRLDVIDVDVWEVLWPVAIIVVGLALLARMSTHDTHDDTIRASVFWWGTQRRTTSQQFRGGALTAIMGGIEVDLREAGIVDRAELSVFAFWGGVEIRVPPTWRVRTVGLPLMGGWDDKTVSPPAPDAPELVVRLTTIMGGAEIKN